MSEVLKPGTHLGAYEILSFIASGGMGSVYKARNRILGDSRAIKVILPSLSSNQEFVARFVREAQLASRIQHPNVVKMLEPAMDGNTMFLPMELLEGESLSDLLKREAPLHPASAIDLMMSVGSGVSALHVAGIIHRDLKPANIFLNNERGVIVPKVLDFGAARETLYDGEQTNTGQVIGSAHYMPVEQASGRKDIDARVDQYALAVMMYLMLTRRRPYENDDMGVALAKIIQGLPYPNVRDIAPWVPVELANVLHRALSRERDQRFASVSDFCGALFAARVGAANVAMPPDLIQRHATPIASGSQPSRPYFGITAGDGSSSASLHAIGPGRPGDASQQTILPQELEPTGRGSSWPKSLIVALVVAFTSIGAVSAIAAIVISMNGHSRTPINTTQPRETTTTPTNGESLSPTTNNGMGGAISVQDAGVAVEPDPNPMGTPGMDFALNPVVDADVPTVRVQRNTRSNNRNSNATGNTGRNPTGSHGCVPRPGIPCL